MSIDPPLRSFITVPIFVGSLEVIFVGCFEVIFVGLFVGFFVGFVVVALINKFSVIADVDRKCCNFPKKKIKSYFHHRISHLMSAHSKMPRSDDEKI
jgi:hypothetical protein